MASCAFGTPFDQQSVLPDLLSLCAAAPWRETLLLCVLGELCGEIIHDLSPRASVSRSDSATQRHEFLCVLANAATTSLRFFYCLATLRQK